jgi:hypothetical protein
MQRWVVLMVVAMGCGRIGFESIASDGNVGEHTCAPEVECNVIANEGVVEVTCDRNVECNVVCAEAASCEVECGGSASCTVACPAEGCRVTGCEGNACTVTCGFAQLASREGSTATCP